MPPVGFEPIISAGERPQTHALDRPATVTGSWAFGLIIFFFGGELNVRLIPTKGCGSRFMVVSIVIRLRTDYPGFEYRQRKDLSPIMPFSILGSA